MQKAAFILALAALFVALLRPPLPMAHAQTPTGDAWRAERNYPPLVFPASRAPETTIATKSVTLGTRLQPATVTTALYEAEDDVAVLK